MKEHIPHSIKQICIKALVLLTLSSSHASADLAADLLEKRAGLLNEIARLESLSSAGTLEDGDLFRLGKLYYASRDFEQDIYQRNRLAVQAGKYFFRYKQFAGLLAQKNIGLFCIDRVRRSPAEGRDPGKEYRHCSVLVSTYFTADGALKPDFTMERIILAAMADELIYDMANRYLSWRADDLLSLATALRENRLAPRDPADVQRALRMNLDKRFTEALAGDSERLRKTALEGVYLLDKMILAAAEGSRQNLLEQREQLMLTDSGREALALKVVDEILGLAERARSAVTAHRIVNGGLPSDLEETGFADEDQLDYVAGISMQSNHLAVSLSGSGELPPSMRGQRIVWSLEKQGTRVNVQCSPHTTLEKRSLRVALGCPS